MASALFTCAVTCQVLWSYVVMHLAGSPDIVYETVPFYVGFICAASVLMAAHRFVRSVAVTGWHCLTVAMAMSMATMVLQFAPWRLQPDALALAANFMTAAVDVASVTFAYYPLIMRSSRMTMIVAVSAAHVAKCLFSSVYPAIGSDAATALSVFAFPAAMCVCVAAGLRFSGGTGRQMPLGRRSPGSMPAQVWLVAAAMGVGVVVCDYMSGRDAWVLGSVSLGDGAEGTWGGVAECVLGACAALFTAHYGRQRLQIGRYQLFFCVVLVAAMSWLYGRRPDGGVPWPISFLLGAAVVYAHVMLWLLTYDLARDGHAPVFFGYGLIFVVQSLATLAWRVSESVAGTSAPLMVLACCAVLATALMAPTATMWQPSAYSLVDGGGQGGGAPVDISAGAATGVTAPLRRRCEECGEAFGLTDREVDVLFLLAQGRTRQAIMDRLVISEGTVRTHIAHIYAKASVHSQGELVDIVYGSSDEQAG